MLLPHAVKADSRAVAYRNKGNVQNRKKPKDKVSSTTAHIATAYEQHPESGRLLTWIWHECPSSTARMVLSWLCNEVPYLGEACSPVELNTYEDYVLPSGVDEQLWTLSPDSALTNIQLPHRGFDGHIRVGSYKGESTSKAEEYVKARNSTLDNLLPIFELSPETVIFGGWDSTRSKNQLRIPSVMVGETYAILAEQEEDPVIHRAGGRIDPVGASVIVSTEADRQKIVGDSIDLSDKTKTSFANLSVASHVR